MDWWQSWAIYLESWWFPQQKTIYRWRDVYSEASMTMATGLYTMHTAPIWSYQYILIGCAFILDSECIMHVSHILLCHTCIHIIKEYTVYTLKKIMYFQNCICTVFCTAHTHYKQWAEYAQWAQYTQYTVYTLWRVNTSYRMFTVYTVYMVYMVCTVNTVYDIKYHT